MMDSSKTSTIFLIFFIFISTATPILGCNTCPKPPSTKPPVKLPPVVPPVKLPPIVPPVKLPPVKLPPVVPPVKLPPVVPSVKLPPIVPPVVKLPPIVPPVVKLPPIVPPVELPPIVPPVKLPPVVTPPKGGAGSPCPPPPSKGNKETCPIDALKLGACVDLLGGLVHIGLGDPAENECCPILGGLVEVEAAVCLCTTLKLKLLNLDIFAPLVLQLLATCGKTPPNGFTCS